MRWRLCIWSKDSTRHQVSAAWSPQVETGLAVGKFTNGGQGASRGSWDEKEHLNFSDLFAWSLYSYLCSFAFALLFPPLHQFHSVTSIIIKWVIYEYFFIFIYRRFWLTVPPLKSSSRSICSQKPFWPWPHSDVFMCILGTSVNNFILCWGVPITKKEESEKASIKLNVQKTRPWHPVLSLHGK